MSVATSPTEIVTALNATPDWFWFVPLLFLLLFIVRIGSNVFQQSKLSDAMFAHTHDLSAEVEKLRSHKAQLIAWGSKAVMHFSGCRGCSVAGQNGSRHKLEDEFNQMMKDMV